MDVMCRAFLLGEPAGGGRRLVWEPFRMVAAHTMPEELACGKENKKKKV